MMKLVRFSILRLLALKCDIEKSEKLSKPVRLSAGYLPE